ncbi:neurotrophin 1 [Anopheles marshallii]|uniref:neurotrophin 1 n=1 Tax=Anopheles marshallii TaxID=1521116 RepID=UPI00237A3C50|nr:neurotrophin 1 [Anopheles marshallii]
MQSRVKLTLVVVVLWTHVLLLHSGAHASTDSGLPDFELDDGKDDADDEYYYVNDGSDQQMQPSHKIISYAKPPATGDSPVPVQVDASEPFLMEDDDTSFEVMDDVDFVEQGTMDFQRKAERMKRIMLKAFANREFQRKFGEVLPLLKVMSKTQKSTLAALITAQVNSREGHTLSLEQVKSMFGNRPELILPLVYDIANMIRTVAQKESLLHEQQQQRERLEEVDKALVEDQGVLSNHLLRRSFSIRSEPHGFRMKDVPAIASDLKDDRLMVDEQDAAKVRTVSTDSSAGEEAGRSARNEPLPFFEKLVQALPRFNVQQTHDKPDDRMTYHERKLNMTAFNATGAQRDQLAMASDGPIPVTLPKVSPKQSSGSVGINAITSTPTTTRPPEVITTVTEHRLTLEEIEDLAFAGLNGTEVDAYGTASGATTTGNGTSTSGSPVAEKLVGGRQRPQGLHTLQPSEKCEYFSGGVCIRVDNYPTSEILYSITRHRHAIGALLAEYIDKANAQDRTVYEPDEIAQGINTKLRKREDDPSKSGGSMCPSIIRYARPQKARSATGEWKYIVNTGEHTQTLRLEKCSTPQDSCTYLTDNFRSRCVQIYNYHRLLSWDAARGLHVDIFKVPTCCSCHIDGYRETFPPLTSYNDFKSKIHEDPSESASTLIRNTHHYSTLQFDQVDEDESDDNIAYQFSNGFQRVKPPKYDGGPLHLPAVPPPPPPPPGPGKTRFDRPPKHPAISKPKHPHFIAPPTLDTYLSPPPNDLAYGIPFKRGPHYTTENALKRAGNVGGPNRRPLRKTSNVQHGDQSIAETDSRLNQVAVLPPSKLDQLPQTQAQNIIEKHRRRQHTTPQPPLTTLQQQQQTPVIFRISQHPATPSIAINPTVPLSTMPQTQPVPSTVSTSTTTVTSTNGHQRINYNYHPIIDFFEEEEVPDVTQEQIDRIGLNSHTSLNSWKPVITGRPRFH